MPRSVRNRVFPVQRDVAPAVAACSAYHASRCALLWLGAPCICFSSRRSLIVTHLLLGAACLIAMFITKSLDCTAPLACSSSVSQTVQPKVLCTGLFPTFLLEPLGALCLRVWMCLSWIPMDCLLWLVALELLVLQSWI